MNYAIVVGDLKDAMEVGIGGTPGEPLKRIAIYNRKGERLIWQAAFRLSLADLRKLGRGLRAAADYLEEEEREKCAVESVEQLKKEDEK